MQQLRREWPQYEKPLSAMQLATRIDLAALFRAAKEEPELGFLASIELL